MKSPNTLLTSRINASLASVRKNRTLCSAVAMMLICPLVFASCQSASSGRTGAPKGDNPYAKYDPKTPEEEDYYRDVYSGDWKEDTQSGLASVYKHGGSTTMPKHWQSMPAGAKTLEEIRFESSQRKMAEMRSMGRALPTTPVARPTTPTMSASAPSYAAQVQPQTNYSVPSVPAPIQEPTVNSYAPTSAPLAQPYAASQPSASTNAYAQNSSPAPSNPASASVTQFVAQAPTASNQGQGVQFVAQAPSQPQTPPAAQTPAVQTPTPTTQTPAIQGPAAVYPQPQQAVYPSGNISASVDLLSAGELIVRGQDPEEEDPFADDSDDEDLFAGEDAEGVDDEIADEGGAQAEEAVEEQEEEEKPAVNVTSDNVNVKSVAPEAKAAVPAGPVESTNVPAAVGASIRSGGKQLVLRVDPSIAEPYANVHRPTDTPAPEDKNQARGKYDEYVVTGGDSKAQVVSRQDWSVENLDVEDSVAHFDSVDGRILTEPSNRVFLYSPRFGAVRQIVGPIEGDQREGVEIANSNEGAVQGEEVAGVDVRTQEIRPLGANSAEQPQGAETTVGITVSTGLQGVMEGDSQLRLGAMLTAVTVDGLSSEDASLMLDGAIAAQGWSGEQGVAVSTDLVNVFSNAYIDGAATVYQIKDDTKTSKLRVIKIANKEAAKPGEFVEFTLRFENIGDQPIGNVTILDNLSSRLRYVDGTAQSSVQADFLADLNERGSLILRWEIEKPLYPKEFGVVRFICKVQ